MTEAPDPTAEPVLRWWQRLLGARIDVTPLRTSRDFRTLFTAGTVFNLGAMFGFSPALVSVVWQAVCEKLGGRFVFGPGYNR